MTATRRHKVALLTLGFGYLLASACTTAAPGADKAGGTQAGSVVLRMASSASPLGDVPPVAVFVRRVATLSRGAVQIRVSTGWGDYTPDAEALVVRAVASGQVDLGWAGSRVFDSLGVSSFEALSAPMLITSYPLENAVLHSSMPGRMLEGLSGVGVSGLAILGDGIRLPLAVHQPLLAPSDWRGVSFGTTRSETQEQTIRSLGATPVEASGPFRIHFLDTGAIQGFELDLWRDLQFDLVQKAPFVAANVALWPQFDVLLANPSLLSRLTDQQRGWLEQAARDATQSSVALANRNASSSVGTMCSIGARFVAATAADLAEMRRATSIVYQSLEHDPQTKAFVRQIQRLKRSTPPGPALHLPSGCVETR